MRFKTNGEILVYLRRVSPTYFYEVARTEQIRKKINRSKKDLSIIDEALDNSDNSNDSENEDQFR